MTDTPPDPATKRASELGEKLGLATGFVFIAGLVIVVAILAIKLFQWVL